MKQLPQRPDAGAAVDCTELKSRRTVPLPAQSDDIVYVCRRWVHTSQICDYALEVGETFAVDRNTVFMRRVPQSFAQSL
jgi:hypothetical protein